MALQSKAHERFDRTFADDVPKQVKRDALRWANWKQDHDDNVASIAVQGGDMLVTYRNGFAETLRHVGGIWQEIPTS